MPIEYIRNRLEKESELVPFTVFSVIVFWAIVAALGAAALWTYPTFVEASEVKQELVALKKNFAVFRVEDRMVQVQDELFKLDREIERIIANEEKVPGIYYEQRNRLRQEMYRLQRRLSELSRLSPELDISDHIDELSEAP